MNKQDDFQNANDFYDDFYENQPFEFCPVCNRDYDDIDFEYQSCSKCGWDAEKEKYISGIYREPGNEDFMSGEADIGTGEWN